MLGLIIIAAFIYLLLAFEIYSIRKQRADLRTIYIDTGDAVDSSNPDGRRSVGTDMGKE